MQIYVKYAVYTYAHAMRRDK